jgi:N-acetylglucosaminyltransferase
MGMQVAVLLLYVALAVAYARLQRHFADARWRAAAPENSGSYRPDVDVIIPCYNEEPALLAACLRSLRAQDYQGRVRVWVVDDGSRNRAALAPVLRSEADPAWRVTLLDGNQGKRIAQGAALWAGQAEVVLTVDSDTTIAPDGIRRIVAPLRDDRIGAVTGDVRPSNPDATWLTRLIETRYRLLFERERAAQGFFGAVLCCAGPFSAYRRKVVERIWQRYVGHRFWGSRRVFGDDLELTNLVLAAGYRSQYEPRAKAATHVPATLLRYARQQLRWNRSFYRELPQILRLLPGRTRFLAVDIAGQTLLPLLLAVGLSVTVGDALLYRSRLPWDAAALVVMALASRGLAPSGPSGRRFAVQYGLVFVVLLLPIRFWAACTLFQSRWGTRTLAAQRSMPVGGLRTCTLFRDRGGARDLDRHWRTRASSLRALRSPTSLPFSRYSLMARSSSLAASPLRPRSRSTSARSTRASARESG